MIVDVNSPAPLAQKALGDARRLHAVPFCITRPTACLERCTPDRYLPIAAVERIEIHMLNALLEAETPLWVTLLIIGIPLGWLALGMKSLHDKINRHSVSIGAFDEWADVVDEKLAQFARPTSPPKKPVALFRGLDRPRGY